MLHGNCYCRREGRQIGQKSNYQFDHSKKERKLIAQGVSLVFRMYAVSWIRKTPLCQFCINLLCQGLLPNISHGSGEGGPGDWLFPCSLQPLLYNGLINAVGIAPMLSLDGNNSCSIGVIEEEGTQHGIAVAEKFENVKALGRCWKADEKWKSGYRICAGKRNT